MKITKISLNQTLSIEEDTKTTFSIKCSELLKLNKNPEVYNGRLKTFDC